MAKYITPLILIIFSYTSLCLSDFRSIEKIAPGVVYYHDYSSSGPWHIHVLEIDLSNPLVELESVKAKKSLFAREKTSTMSGKLNSDNHYIAGAINADFFEWDGLPVGVQVINGLLIHEPTTRSIFGMSVDKKPFIDIVDYKGQLFIDNRVTYQINGLNRIKKANELILFNSYYNADTMSYTGGTIIRAKLLSDNFDLKDTIEFQISRIEKVDGITLKSFDISENEIVLIGPDNNFSDLKFKDEIRILQDLLPITDGVYQAIGGLPRLIRDGNLSIEWKKEKIRESFSTKRHPRTAVGFTEDKKKVFLFVVDGRQLGYSVGMTLPELADYMLEWGVYQGVNLDGGGSSTMVVHNEVSNSPSDSTGERPVANALMVVNTASKSNMVQLDINPDHIILSPGTTIQFDINLQDINFHPTIGQLDSVIWSCDPNLGMVDSTGFFIAEISSGTGFLYVQSGCRRDSARVSIIDNPDNKPLK